MESKTYSIEGNNASLLTEAFIKHYEQDAYESTYKGGFIRIFEDYSYLNGNDIMVCIRVDTNEAMSNKIIVEFIAGGSRKGLLSPDNMWSSESRRVANL